MVKCDKAGMFPYPGDCRKFVHCYDENGRLKSIVQDCPPGTVFREESAMCGFPTGNNGC
ncbi:chitin binding peritrophin-A domain-containing protein [Staphylococcus aureus]|uniref:chitin binding peritrophin-A domain-containing protein n=1 Tax=Staphylococcus aureus TaxID=1280 RepID=UPI0038B32AD6